MPHPSTVHRPNTARAECGTIFGAEEDAPFTPSSKSSGERVASYTTTHGADVLLVVEVEALETWNNLGQGVLTQESGERGKARLVQLVRVERERSSPILTRESDLR
jgi:hypothetical protein